MSTPRVYFVEEKLLHDQPVTRQLPASPGNDSTQRDQSWLQIIRLDTKATASEALEKDSQRVCHVVSVLTDETSLYTSP